MIQIKSYPAKNGDSFLVKASDSPFAMLVDGGYAETFKQHIKADLQILAAQGHELDLVVATHVDADHISGLLSLFRQNGHSDSPKIIPVREVFHNGLRSLKGAITASTPIHPDDMALLQEIRNRGYPPPPSAKNLGQEISARQGNALAELLRQGGYQWNTGDGTRPVGKNGLAELRLPNASVQILGPNKHRLDALKSWWISEIRRFGLACSLENLDDTFEFVCAHEVITPEPQALASSNEDLARAHFPDSSITNGSSISFVLEIGAMKLLFLGDAWAEDIVEEFSQNGPTVFDAVKISHHGSLRNTSPKLLELIDSPHFLISTNGEGHDHPDFAVLKAIVDRPTTFPRTLHFNYSTPSSRRLHNYRRKAGVNFTVEEGNLNWISLINRHDR